jgi:glycosyltransferase involved in cell wall biosynthesis
VPVRDRPLRVLHVGNVANNAYLNAKLLNAAGLECDVLAYAHYHIMGCPEWEEGDFTGAIDESRPDWSAVDLKGYQRPRWFAQGPIADAVAYLDARRTGASSAERRWRRLELRRRLITGRRWEWLRRLRRLTEARSAPPPQPPSAAASVSEEVKVYGALRGWPIAEVTSLFRHYDVVHAYGAEPVLAFATGARPYVAFEHGTLRSLPFEPSMEGRLTAIAYQHADAVIITNADNRAAAQRLGLRDFRFVPHPIAETFPDREAVQRLRADLAARLQADFLLFHPSRHHWGPERNPHLEKANDRLIDGLAVMFRQRPGAAAVFVKWGATLAASESRLRELGIANRVHWIEPVPGPVLARYMAAADVVADQFYLGAFGAITPRALSLAVPALLHLDAEAHRWAFADPPPVMNASAPEQIAGALQRGYDDRAWLTELGRRGRTWYERFHSNDMVTAALIDTYHAVTS